MARRKRKPGTLGRSIQDQAADGLTYLFNTALRLREQRTNAGYGLADRVEIGASSLIDALKKKGMDCSCKITAGSHGHNYSCRCADTDSRPSRKATMKKR